MSTIRGYVGTDIYADTGEIAVLVAPQGSPGTPYPPGFGEDIVTMRMRIKTNQVDPAGTMLVTVRHHDGNDVQEWNVSLNTTEDTFFSPARPNYAEQGLEIWFDHSRDVTIQVRPLAAGGSVDVLLDYVEL